MMEARATAGASSAEDGHRASKGGRLEALDACRDQTDSGGPRGKAAVAYREEARMATIETTGAVDTHAIGATFHDVVGIRATAPQCKAQSGQVA